MEMLPFYGTTEPNETSLAPRAWIIPNAPAGEQAAAPAENPAAQADMMPPPGMGMMGGMGMMMGGRRPGGEDGGSGCTAGNHERQTCGRPSRPAKRLKRASSCLEAASLSEDAEGES